MLENQIQPPTPATQHRFHFLDALRGIAAILVIPRHAPHAIGGKLATFNSFLAVDFFFCLSGFVIAFSYENRLLDSLTFRNFVVTRIIRLYPIAVAGTLLGAVSHTLDGSFLGHQVSPTLMIPLTTLLGLAVLPFPHNMLFPLDTPMWTLFLELSANFAYAALLKRSLLTNAVLCLIAAVSFGGLIGSALYFGSLDLGFFSGTIIGGIARVCFSFPVGVLLYRFYRYQTARPFFKAPAIIVSAALVSVLLLLLCSPLNWIKSIPTELSAIGILFPIIVYLGARIPVRGSVARLSAFLGTISYPVYLLHQPILRLLWRFDSKHVFSDQTIIIYFFTLMITVWMISRFYESPVRRLLTKIVRRREATTIKVAETCNLVATSTAP
jgi:peptidoglycan/LPS O-acetylase OafA/YrhL